MCFNDWNIGSASIRRYGFIEVGLALLEKMDHCEGGLCGNIYKLKLCPVWDSKPLLLLLDQDVELLTPLTPNMPIC